MYNFYRRFKVYDETREDIRNVALQESALEVGLPVVTVPVVCVGSEYAINDKESNYKRHNDRREDNPGDSLEDVDFMVVSRWLRGLGFLGLLFVVLLRETKRIVARHINVGTEKEVQGFCCSNHRVVLVGNSSHISQ